MSTTTTSENGDSLEQAAREAVARFPQSDIQVATAFCEKVLPEFIGVSNDRLVKVGRSLVNLVDMAPPPPTPSSSTEKEDNDCCRSIPLAESLELLLQECQLLLSGELKVPKVRFGKTELEMPIVTLGCMRFQQEWGPRITNLNMVGSDCQDNLVEILKTAIGYGMTHIETARGYGCSELQLGTALKQLFLTNQVKREDLIIQTKIPPNKDPSEFRKALEVSFRNLQVDYLDLFALHGMNFEEQLPWVFDGEGENCMTVIQEYMDAGKIRHLGFSTHGSTEHILKCINKNVFEYVNLHYHYFGSYTASGGGHDGQGNLDCVKLLQEKDMGIFIISPYDKGGRVYAPSRKLRSLTLPEMEPMAFKSGWIWNHHRLQDGLPQLHTITVGAARPSDLDQPAVAAYLHATKPQETLEKVKVITQRLDEAKEKALGKEWLETWWKGLPKSDKSKFFIEHNQIVWIYNMIQAFGMYEFGKARYNSFEKNGEKWDDSMSPEENISQNIGQNAWGFVPGLPMKPGQDYSEDLANVPEENKARVREAEAFVYKWCRDNKVGQEEAKLDPKKKRLSFFRRNFSVSSQMFRLPSLLFEEKKVESDNDRNGDECETIPKEWETAYDMRPWPDYPDQPSRA